MVWVIISVPAGISGSGGATALGATGAWSSFGAGADFASAAGAAAAGAGLGAGALARSAALSPSARMVAIGVLTATSAVPSGIRILPSVPSSVASYSIVALSVSISAITSPDLIVSPSFLSHLTRLPFSIVGDSAGMRILAGIALPVTDGLRRLDHFGDGWQRQFFQIGGVWHRHVLARNARDRRIEIVESLLHQARGNLRADAGLCPALFHGDAAAGFLHRGDNRLGIHRPDGAQIDDLGIDPGGGEFLRCLERVGHSHRPGDDGDV